jgi:hypothetical protein
MEQIAAADSTYVSEYSAKLVSGYFQLRDLGETRIKGLSDPLHVFELEGVGRMRTRLDVSRARGFTKFVGRQNEMATLEAALEQAIAGNAQVVGVVAEPGTGKSRLCYEFAERCRAREIPVYEAHGVAHGKTVPLLPILRLGTRLWEFSALLTKTHALRKLYGIDARKEIEAAIAEADTWLETTGAKSYAPFLHLERAELARLTGDEDTRERELREAHRLFTETAHQFARRTSRKSSLWRPPRKQR